MWDGCISYSIRGDGGKDGEKQCEVASLVRRTAIKGIKMDYRVKGNMNILR